MTDPLHAIPNPALSPEDAAHVAIALRAAGRVAQQTAANGWKFGCPAPHMDRVAAELGRLAEVYQSCDSGPAASTTASDPSFAPTGAASVDAPADSITVQRLRAELQRSAYLQGVMDRTRVTTRECDIGNPAEIPVQPRNRGITTAKAEIMRLYPMPKVKRARVVTWVDRSRSIGTADEAWDFMVLDGKVKGARDYPGRAGAPIWFDVSGLVFPHDPALWRLWADLLDTPTELVDAHA